jgi:Gene product 88
MPNATETTQTATQTAHTARMADPNRPLLTAGNRKLGAHVGAWSVPAVDTCPGMTRVCARVCYAKRYCRRLGLDYSANREALRAPGFVTRMAREAELYRLVRINVSGDFASQQDILSWRLVARACPHTVFWAYTRSWRLPKLLARLESVKAEVPNLVILWSCDRGTGIPIWMNKQDVVWMATEDTDIPPRPVRIVFRHRRSTRMAKMACGPLIIGARMSTVCPAENGVANSVTCQRCRLCFREAL